MHEKERKLIDEFEVFCKYYCPNKNKYIGEEIDYQCVECNLMLVELCNYCPIEEYIRHIRDVI